jgi:aminopeptidase-like protein
MMHFRKDAELKAMGWQIYEPVAELYPICRLITATD